MSTCCTNPFDLGCSLSCEDLVFPIAGFEGDTFSISFDMNGANKQQTAIITNGILSLPSDSLPESAGLTFTVTDAVGDFVGCFKTTRKVQL